MILSLYKVEKESCLNATLAKCIEVIAWPMQISRTIQLIYDLMLARKMYKHLDSEQVSE